MVVREDCSKIGIGVILRDWNDHVNASLRKPLTVCVVPISIEVKGFLEAATFCYDFGLISLLYKGDSMLVVQATSSLEKIHRIISYIILDFRLLIVNTLWQIQHVKK